MKRVVPRIRIAEGQVLSLYQLSRQKGLPIERSHHCLRRWIERGVKSEQVIVHLPAIRIQGAWHSSVPALVAFLSVLQDFSQATVAALGEKLGPPVMYLKGDVFQGMK
jgi:hypothetical protein